MDYDVKGLEFIMVGRKHGSKQQELRVPIFGSKHKAESENQKYHGVKTPPPVASFLQQGHRS